jgi:hypothetical protein
MKTSKYDCRIEERYKLLVATTIKLKICQLVLTLINEVLLFCSKKGMKNGSKVKGKGNLVQASCEDKCQNYTQHRASMIKSSTIAHMRKVYLKPPYFDLSLGLGEGVKKIEFIMGILLVIAIVCLNHFEVINCLHVPTWTMFVTIFMFYFNFWEFEEKSKDAKHIQCQHPLEPQVCPLFKDITFTRGGVEASTTPKPTDMGEPTFKF